jgi:hypothetical protein
VAAQVVTNTAVETAPRPETKGPIVIDLGKHRRKRVKDLRRGTGRLAEEVNDCIMELQAAGTISPSAQTVVVVVREKRKSKSLKGLLPGL